MVSTYGRNLTGHAHGNDDERVRRNPSNPVSTISRKGSAVSTVRETDAGLVNRRAVVARMPREAPVAPQKKPATPALSSKAKLPWLDGKPPSAKSGTHSRLRSMPGAFSDSSATPSLDSNKDRPKTDSNLSKQFTVANPALRSVASVPRLRTSTSKPALTRKISSLGSDGTRLPTIHPQTAARRKPSDTTPYTPSVYSVGAPSDLSVGTSTSRPKDPASYEELLPKQRDFSDSDQPLIKDQGLQRAESAVQPTKFPLMGRDIPLPPVDTSPLTVMSASTSTSPLSPGTGGLHVVPLSKAPKQDGLNRTITGLEDLMHEAIHVAKDAAKARNTEEVSEILEEATLALKRASVVSREQSMAVLPPLAMSDSSLGSSDESSYDDSDASSFVDPRSARSSATVLTAGTHPSQVIIVPPYAKDGRAPESDRGVVVDPSKKQSDSVSSHSIAGTPPRFYNPPSVEFVTRDFAYEHNPRRTRSNSDSTLSSAERRKSFRRTKTGLGTQHVNFPIEPATVMSPSGEHLERVMRSLPSKEDVQNHIQRYNEPPEMPRHSSLKHKVSAQQDAASDHRDGPLKADLSDLEGGVRRRRKHGELDYGQKPYKSDYDAYRELREKRNSSRLSRDTKGLSLKHRHHFTIRADEKFSLRHHHRRQPVARNWSGSRKRITAVMACVNTSMIGLIVGVYAGEVPSIQYQLADEHHYIIQGNVYLYIGLAISTFFFWPLPLLHGRKPYTLAALAIALPLQFPQAVVVGSPRDPRNPGFRSGLLMCRFFTGLALGFANINFITTLFDLFGASLQSANPHQELVLTNDVRRHGGGMGLWLGFWSWCFIGSLALGFLLGAGIIADLNPEWGFYIIVILLAFVLLLNVITPETRRSPYRRSVAEVVDDDDRIKRRVARGEVKLHISETGPKYWIEEVIAGIRLSSRMFFQRGFLILALYLGWIYAQVVLIIVLLGALLSREYHFRPQYVGLGVLAIAIGALLAVPLAKASLFSRARTNPARTDSMTFQPRITWTSHLVRRVTFMIVLPFVGLAYTMLSAGRSIHYMLPIVFAGVIGFLSNLAIAECHGLIMETYDTSDLQPGANSRHRLQSMASNIVRRRTNYSSFPRVTAGIFVAQTIAFLLAAAATGVGGVMTRTFGAQAATGVTAGILLGLTVLLTAALWRFKEVQVIPNHAFGSRSNTTDWSQVDEYWKPVIIGNPSGKMRRMSLLELGKQSRWTEIRKLNKLIRE